MPAIFGFDFGDEYVAFDGLKFAFRIVTFENVYGLDAAAVTTERAGDRLKIRATSFQYAGGQRRCPGELEAEIWREGESLRFKADTSHQHDIKCITILIRDLAEPPEGYEEKVYGWPLGPTDLTDHFPFHDIPTEGGGTAAILPATTTLRYKRWAVYREHSGEYVLNISEDEEYTKRSPEMHGSEWVLYRNQSQELLTSIWYSLLERERGLRPWNERTDVPGWFRKVSLVLNMHCESWTGYVFNDFERQLEILKWIADRYDADRVLVYLAGWDGRYYWNYPLYEPSEACGGVEGLKTLVSGAHELGMHVVPMFGVIASNYQNTKKLGLEKAACTTHYGIEEICDWTDWDEDLSNEPVWQPLNVGEPGFRKYLFDRVCDITDTFGTDGVMLDISGRMPRDPRYSLYDGLVALVEDLKNRYDNFLLFGENGCDLHLPLFHLFHHAAGYDAGHPFFRYCRSSYHLFCGAPGKGSNGVFESGRNPYVRIDPTLPAIPTLAIVNDTLPDYAEEVARALQAAKEWERRHP